MNNNDFFPGFDDEACDFLAIKLQKVEGVDRCLILRVKGQIDTYSSHFFQSSVSKLIDAGFVHLILSLRSVDCVSSKAVGSLIRIRKAARDMGGEIVMVHVHPKVREVFRNLSLEKFFCCADSLDEAMALMKRDRKASAREDSRL